MLQWIEINETLLLWLGFLSLLMFIGTLLIIPILVLRIPEDYFVREKRYPSRWSKHHPVIRYTVSIVKNLSGAVFIMAGIAMLFFPGQGILTILIGITLMNFPGKFQLERWIISHRPVRKAIQWLREKARRPPLKMKQRGKKIKSSITHPRSSRPQSDSRRTEHEE